MDLQILKEVIFPTVLKRIEERKDSLVNMTNFPASGLEGWFKVEIIAALAITNYPVRKVRNRGVDLVLEGEIKIELKGKTNFPPKEIKAGLDHGTLCLFLVNGKNQNSLKKLENSDDVEMIYHEPLNDGRNEWIIGLIKPA